MLSMMEFLSRQVKKASRASQQRARWVRSGAMGAPSVEIFGGGGEGEEAQNPIVMWSCDGRWKGVAWELDLKNLAMLAASLWHWVQPSRLT